MTVTPTEKPLHPLCAAIPLQIPIFETWKDWLVYWNTPLPVDLCYGALFSAWQIPQMETITEIDRLVLFLELAEGHNNSSNFKDTDWRNRNCWIPLWSKYGSIEELRRSVAKKAYQMLCIHFFKRFGTESAFHEHLRDVQSIIAAPRALKALLHFFRAAEDQYCNLTNLRWESDNDHDSHARDFLLNLIRCIWQFQKTHQQWSDIGKKALKAARPRTIRMLWCMDSLHLLYPWSDCICLDSLMILKDLALGLDLNIKEIGWRGNRRPLSLEEAVAFGSKPACVLHLIIMKEKWAAQLRRAEKAEDIAEAAMERARRKQIF